jgi:hypothetical protein
MCRELSVLLLLAASAAVAGTQVLGRTGLLHRVVGNTIHFQGGGEDVFEYLDPTGEIRGESSAHGKFTARWRLLDDRTMCFESADPMASGCVGVELKGTRITFLRRDGVVEGPFELLAGNPRSL